MLKSAKAVIRKCREEDLDMLLAVERASFPNPYDRYVFTYYLSTVPEGFLVAEKEAEILGYLIATTQGGSGLIVSVAVSPTNRRRGIGSMLMQTALNELAKKARSVSLQVSVKNKAGIDFYHKFSFREIVMIKNYYPDGKDAILMAREI